MALLEIKDSVGTSLDAIANLAIAIKKISKNQQHVGILYRIEGHELLLLNLRWHFDLRNELPDGSYFWIPSKLDERLLMTLAEWIGVIWARNEKGLIPYSIEFTGRYFDANGTYVRSALGEGLTCATFVMAIFSAFGLPLLDVGTWQKRLSDRSWQKKILAALEENGAPGHHVRQQKKWIGAASRFRPEEVAAGFGIFRGTPIAYKEVLPLAEKVLTVIKLPA